MAAPKSRWKRFLILLGALALLTLIAWFVAGAWADGRVAAARARLEAVTGPVEALKRRFPHGGPNESALRLEELAARLSTQGLSLVPQSRPGEIPPPERDASLREQMSKWLTAQLEDPSCDVAEAPAELLAFLAEHDATLAEMTALLRDGEPPRWEQSAFDDGVTAPVPNLLGHINVTRLLLARGLVHARDGETERASESLEAAWAFANALDERAFLISRLIAIAELRYVAVALRKVDVDPAAWRLRLDDVPLLDDPGELLFGESVVPVQLGTSTSAAEMAELTGGGAGERWLYRIAKPYVRASAAEGIEAHATLIERLRSADPCELARGENALGFSLDELFSRWNVIMRIAMPNPLTAAPRLERMAVDLALTRQLLEARLAAAQGIRGTEEVVAGRCSEWRWERVIAPDGALTLTWAGPELWTNPAGIKSPLSVTPGGGGADAQAP